MRMFFYLYYSEIRKGVDFRFFPCEKTKKKKKEKQSLIIK